MSGYATQRTTMVDTQIRPSDVTKFPVIDAMLTVKREAFVPTSQRASAYAGCEIVLATSRVMFEPRTLGKMIDELDVQVSDVALVIGAGLGYSTAVLAHMLELVIGLEAEAELASEAETNLGENDADNAIIVQGNVADGAARHGPYDVILIEGGVEFVPEAILSQLKEGGRIACIFMEGQLGTCRIGFKSSGQVSWRFAFNATAPVLSGFEATRGFAL